MATFTFGNFDGLAFVDNGIVSQTLNAYGMTGRVTNVSIGLGGLSHSWATDLDMLLEAPDGSNNLEFWSDAGSGLSISNANIPIADSGATALSYTGAPTSGTTYRPADYDDVEIKSNFGSVANTIQHPASNGSATFASSFSGIAFGELNGLWKLYVADDAVNDVGSLRNWHLSITTDNNFVDIKGANADDVIRNSYVYFDTGTYQLNDEAAVLYSGVVNFQFYGGGGNDTILGSSASESFTGGTGRDTIHAGGELDLIYINDGEDVAGEVYDGGLGNDRLITGYIGSYTLNLRDDEVTSIEWIDFGYGVPGATATIQINAAQIGPGISSTARIDGTLNNINNAESANAADRLDIIMGTATALDLSGMTFVDFSEPGDAVIITGDGDPETIKGSSVADRIDGRGGADTMTGLAGNDIYTVDNAADTIVEIAGGGLGDWVRASVTYDLLAGVDVENLSTTDDKGTAKINLYGNEITQTITGNAGANIISDGGKGGADVLVGLGGDDTYRVYNSGTTIVEAAAAGNDTVQAAVNYTVGKGVYIQVLETTNAAGKAAISLYSNEFGQTINGNAGNNVLRGYGGDDTINGGDGADKISGGLGSDTLAGNAGADTYYFSNALGPTNIDTINGFSSIDLISLSSSIFTQAGPPGALAAGAFWSNTTGLAHDGSDRIIWETDTGRLYYDPDGTGAAARVLFAVVTGNTGPMNAGDFVIA